MKIRKNKKLVSKICMSLSLATAVMTVGADMALVQAAVNSPYTYTFETISGNPNGDKEIVVDFGTYTINNTVAIDKEKITVEPFGTNIIDPFIDANGKLHIQPINLDPSIEEYKVTIKPDALTFSNYTQYDNFVIDFNIKDVMPGFKTTFLDGDADAINDIYYAGNTSEDIKMFVPERYITGIAVLHRVEVQGSTTLTNIDIEAAVDVEKIMIEILDSDAPETTLGNVTRTLDKNGTQFSTGWAGLEGATDGKHDLLVKAYSVDGKLLESKQFKLGVSGSNTDFQKDDYVNSATANVYGQNMTVKDILAGSTSFEEMLNTLTTAELEKLQLYYPKKINVQEVGTLNELSVVLTNNEVDTMKLTNNLIIPAGKQMKVEKDMFINGNNKTVTGNVYLGKDNTTDLNITLRDMNITGNLIIDVGDYGDANIDNVTVSGTVTILSGNTSSVKFNDFTASYLNVDNDTTAVRVVLSGNTRITNTELTGSNDVILLNKSTAPTNGSFGALNVDSTATGAEITLGDGTFPSLEVEDGANVVVTVESDASLTALDSDEDIIIVGQIPTNSGNGTVDNSSTTADPSKKYGMQFGGTLLDNPTEGALAMEDKTLTIILRDGAKWESLANIKAAVGSITAAIPNLPSLGATPENQLNRISDTVLQITIPKITTYTTDYTNRAIVVTPSAMTAAMLGTPAFVESTYTAVTMADSEPVGNVTMVSESGNVTLNNTTTNMQYSLNSTNGINGNWTVCTNPTTTFAAADGQKISVRDKDETSNYRVIGTVNSSVRWVATEAELRSAITTLDIDRIALSNDITLTTGDLNVNNSSVIDLNGKKITLGTNDINLTENGATLKRGTVVSEGTGYINITKAAVVEDIIINKTAGDATPIQIGVNSGNVALRKLNITQADLTDKDVITIAGGATDNTVVTLSGSTIKANDAVNPAINVGQKATLIATDNTFTSVKTTISLGASSKITATGNKFDSEAEAIKFTSATTGAYSVTGNTFDVAAGQVAIDAAIVSGDNDIYALVNAMDAPNTFVLPNSTAAKFKTRETAGDVVTGTASTVTAGSITSYTFTNVPSSVSKIYVKPNYDAITSDAVNIGQIVASNTGYGAFNYAGYTEYTPGANITVADTQKVTFLFTDASGRIVTAKVVGADLAVPTISSKETQDLDSDGKIDAVKITFNEAIKDSTVTATDFDVAGYTGEAFSSTTNSDVADNNVIYITFTEGASVDTGATPNLTYTAGTLKDLSGNALATAGAAATTDAAKPVLMTKEYYDHGGNHAVPVVDGTVDTIKLVFSEDLSDAASASADFTVSKAGDATTGGQGGTAFAETLASDAANDNTLWIEFTNGITGSTLEDYEIAIADAKISDGTNTMAALTATDATDKAAPVLKTAVLATAGTAADWETGEIVTLTFSEDVTVTNETVLAASYPTFTDFTFGGNGTSSPFVNTLLPATNVVVADGAGSTVTLTGTGAGGTIVVADPNANTIAPKATIVDAAGNTANTTAAKITN